MRIRSRRVSAALVALLPLAAMLSILQPNVAFADATQNNGCLGVTGTFSQFAVPIKGTASPDPVTAPNPVTLSGTSVSVAVDKTLISAGVVTGLVSAADNLADIGVTKNDGTPSATAGVNAVSAAVGSVKLLIRATNTTELNQTAANTSVVNLTFYVTADSAGGSVVVYSAISAPPAAAPNPSRTGTVLSGSLNVNIPLANTVWTPTGGDIAFTEANVAPANLSTPSVADQGAAPLILLPKINGAINVPFRCWPGTVAAAANSPLTPGASVTIDTVTVTGGSSTSSTGGSSSSTSSTTSTTPGETSTTETTTTVPGGSTTTLPASNTATGDYAAQCTNSVTPDISTLTFHVTGTAPSTATAGSAVTLSNQSWKLDVPGSVLTAGVNLGLLAPGDVVAGSITAGVFASNTSEGTQTSAPIPVEIGPIAVDAVSGLANDASSTFSVPDMTWTAVGGDVGFSLAPTTANVTIGPLDIQFSCDPGSSTGSFLTVIITGSSGGPVAGRGPTTTAPATGGTTRDQVLGRQLARTGSPVGFYLTLGLTLLDFGYLFWSAAQPPRRRMAS